jgi:type IV pilus assembly protein PilN
MIRINLLPHREAKRIKNKRVFVHMLILAALFAGAVVFVVGLFIAEKISEQAQRNVFITAKNKELDKQIEQIATLKQDIEALKARQQAVEDLQSDRNQPAYLLDELVKQVPEGVYLHNFKQEGQKVAMTGVAQSNERVSELLHNLGTNSPWLDHPELIEIKSSIVGQGRDSKKVFEFTMSVGIKRLRDKDNASTDKASTANLVAADKTGNGKPREAVAGLINKPADKLVPTDKAPTTSDKATPVKSASDAAASGAVVNAPKKP